MENIKKTVRGILWEKFLVVLEKSSFSEIFIFLFKCVIFIFFSLSLVNIPKTIKLLKYAWFYGDFLVLKLVFVFVFVFFYKSIVNSFKNLYFFIYESLEKIFFITSSDPLEKNFFGVPVYELVDYIFENKSFRRDDIESVFGVSRWKYESMVKELDGVKIFIRGENNSRVLNSDYSRADVVSILSSFDGVELRPLVRNVWNNSFVFSPSMPEILKRSIPSPGGFVKRSIKN